MAKLQRTPTRHAVSKSKPKSRKPAVAQARVAMGQKPKPKPSPHPPERVPVVRSSYAEAIATYERGLAAIQKKQYRLAADTLRSVITQFPDEKELHERVQLYLRVCDRHLTPVDTTARTPDEQVYAATLAVNEGSYDRAIELTSAALASNPDLGNAEYILSVALTLKGDLTPALTHLRKAIDLNPENRELARRDVDLDMLRRVEDARNLLASQGPNANRKDRRPANSRSRSGSR